MNLREARILVVEDDAAMRQFVLTLLARLGVHRVKEATDGAAGLTVARNFEPDLVLSDIHMQPMDGLEFVRQLRAHPSAALRNVPVLMMTADTTPATLKNSIKHGVSAYIVKPPLLVPLRTKLEQALKSR